MIQSASQERMNEAEISQPATTAVQIALVDLLMAWDIKPSVTIGHSSGTFAFHKIFHLKVDTCIR